MAIEMDGETKVIKSAKAVKRVRFSDDVKCVDFAESDDSGSVTFENDNKNVGLSELLSPLESENMPHGKSVVIDKNEGSDSSSRSDDNNNNEMLLSLLQMNPGTYQTFSQISDSSEDECLDEQQECHMSDNELKDYNDDLENNSMLGNNLENQDLMGNLENQAVLELINETMSMVISSVERDNSVVETLPEEKPPNSVDGFGHNSNTSLSMPLAILPVEPSEVSVPISPSKIDSEIRVQQKMGDSSMSRKRSLDGIFVEKQTSKLNNCLSKNNPAFASADELKSAVYNAWNTVKKESSVVHNEPKIIPVTKKTNQTIQKSDSKVYDTWKKSKMKSKKKSNKVLETSFKKSKSEADVEEGKMAFKAWKKRKDEILRQKMIEKHRKEEKERFDSLMSEKMRKNDAEIAFQA